MMPCPKCQTLHYHNVENIVNCKCGASLKFAVPLLFWDAMPYGWKWVVQEKAELNASL
jgi:hypothetical protein